MSPRRFWSCISPRKAGPAFGFRSPAFSLGLGLSGSREPEAVYYFPSTSLAMVASCMFDVPS